MLQDLVIPVFYLNGQAIEVVQKHKYLGVILCEDRCDDIDISRQVRSMYSRGNSILKHFRSCSQEVKCTLFKTYCSSMYCPHLWRNFSASGLKRLKVAYNRIFRYMFNLTARTTISGNLLKLNIRCFNTIIRTYASGFMKRLLKSDNNILETISSSVHFYSSRQIKQWCNDVYIESQ